MDQSKVVYGTIPIKVKCRFDHGFDCRSSLEYLDFPVDSETPILIFFPENLFKKLNITQLSFSASWIPTQTLNLTTSPFSLCLEEFGDKLTPKIDESHSIYRFVKKTSKLYGHRIWDMHKIYAEIRIIWNGKFLKEDELEIAKNMYCIVSGFEMVGALESNLDQYKPYFSTREEVVEKGKLVEWESTPELDLLEKLFKETTTRFNNALELLDKSKDRKQVLLKFLNQAILSFTLAQKQVLKEQ